jgi:hypothetical protein
MVCEKCGRGTHLTLRVKVVSGNHEEKEAWWCIHCASHEATHG